MYSIWKFPLEEGKQIISMPVGAEILSVQTQRVPTIWAVVCPDSMREDRVFELIGTGHSIKTMRNRKYIGTTQQEPFVWHVFELTGQGEK